MGKVRTTFPEGVLGVAPKLLCIADLHMGGCMALIQQFDFDGTLSLGTLAANTAVSAFTNIDPSRAQGWRAVMSEWLFSMSGKTTAEGPIIFGIACNMTAPEIELALESDPQNKNDSDNRGDGTYIKSLGTIGLLVTDFPSAFHEPKSDDKMIVKYGKNGWSIPEGEALSVWAYNQGGAPLTTGTNLCWFAEHFGVWLND